MLSKQNKIAVKIINMLLLEEQLKKLANFNSLNTNVVPNKIMHFYYLLNEIILILSKSKWNIMRYNF